MCRHWHVENGRISFVPSTKCSCACVLAARTVGDLRLSDGLALLELLEGLRHGARQGRVEGVPRRLELRGVHKRMRRSYPHIHAQLVPRHRSLTFTTRLFQDGKGGSGRLES